MADLTPIEKARATLGEHYEHFVIITASDNEYDVIYNRNVLDKLRYRIKY